MITTTIEQWLNVLASTGISYKARTYNEIYFTLNHHKFTDPLDPNPKYHDSEITIKFDETKKFMSIQHKQVPKIKHKNLVSTARLADWTNLLKNSDIYYAKKSFQTRRWSTYWLEFPVSSSDGSDRIVIDVAYDRHNYEVFAIDSGEIY